MAKKGADITKIPPEPIEPRQRTHAGARGTAKDEYEVKIAPYLADIQADVANGATESQLYKKYKVGKTTFSGYKKKYPELAAAIDAGRKTDRIRLVNKAHEIATGYDYVETTVVEYWELDDSGKKKITGGKTTTVTKHAKADSGIMQFLLINRFPNNAENPDGFARDPQVLEIRREMLELKKKLSEQGDEEGGI